VLVLHSVSNLLSLIKVFNMFDVIKRKTFILHFFFNNSAMIFIFMLHFKCNECLFSLGIFFEFQLL